MGIPLKQTKTLFANIDRQLLPLWVKLAICFGLSVIVAFLAIAIVRQSYIAMLSSRVNTMAALISPERVTAIKDNAEGSQEDYDTLKDRLKNVKAANPDGRFVYLMARNESNKSVYFLVDSEDPGTDGYSPRGEAYPEASTQLVAMFDNKKTLVEGPVSDRWGSWLSILAPIIDDEGRVVGVVGLDIPSSTYVALLVTAAATPITLALLVAAIILLAERSRRKRVDTFRMRSQIVSIASHELQTPLDGILWGQETLMKSSLSESDAKILDNMHESTLTLQESIGDMMQLTGLQDNATTPKLKRVTTNLIELIDNAVTSQQLPAQQKNVTLGYGPNWPALVMANIDAQQIKRVFTSLISNAVKYSKPNATVTVDYELVEGGHVFSIQDHGIGIPESEQSQVFGGFYRASNAIKQSAIGTGMGLYTSRNAIEQHGGKLWLKSEEGRGTTIYVQIPK